jgi:endonuclease/exonuclease/phosphatase family metal-dependent hydrolase
MAKKSRIRIAGKKTFIIINVLVSVMLLYPLYFSPSSLLWLNGFLGLITPYLLVIEILFLVFWLIAKPIWSLPSLISLVLGWKLIVSLVGLHPGIPFSQKKKDNTLRIVSWNVKGFNGLLQKSTMKLRTQEIVYSIQKWSPDIICLQEYNTNERPGDIGNHAQYFEAEYPYSFFSKDYQGGQSAYFSGCIIYSRYKIINAERIPFTNDESLIYVNLQKGDDTIRVYTTHLASYRLKENDFKAIESGVRSKWKVVKKMKQAFTERSVQAQLVKAHMNESPYPSILTGDFNDVPHSYTYRMIVEGWQDAFLEKGFGIGATYMGLSPTLRIDYILANKDWQVKSWEQVDENLSDHQMIMADLQLKKQ